MSVVCFLAPIALIGFKIRFLPCSFSLWFLYLFFLVRHSYESVFLLTIQKIRAFCRCCFAILSSRPKYWNKTHEKYSNGQVFIQGYIHCSLFRELLGYMPGGMVFRWLSIWNGLTCISVSHDSIKSIFCVCSERFPRFQIKFMNSVTAIKY